MVSNWFHYQSIGRIMGVLSLSFLIGDSVSRLYLSLFVSLNFTWSNLFFISGVSMLSFTLMIQFFVYNSPTDFNYEEYEGDPRSLTKSENEKDENHAQILFRIFKSPLFWFITIIYIGLTFLRYVLIDWIPLFLSSRTTASNANASLGSTLPPLFGAASTLIIGFLNDKLSTNLRNLTLLLFQIVTIGLSGILSYLTYFHETDLVVSMILFGCLGFSILGPYSLPASAISNEYGGKKANATVSGLLDAFSLIGAR
jgi:MFS transporter, OPA family, glycerol-3-phosphate transporter